jgi:hypothetical protein
MTYNDIGRDITIIVIAGLRFERNEVIEDDEVNCNGLHVHVFVC